MVKYYGRAKTRTGSVNTTQLGLKLAGCPSNVGRKGTLTRVVQKRVNCVLKVCGWRPVHGVIGRKPGIFNFPSEPNNALAKEAWSGPFPCTLAQPFTRGVKGGIGHIYTPRTRCGCTCVADCSGMDDRFFPVGTPQYGIPRCAGGECCFLVTNAPICRTQVDLPPNLGPTIVHCFPGGPQNGLPGDRSWRGMVQLFFDANTQPNLPPVDGGFENRCWVTRQDVQGVSPTAGQTFDIVFAAAVSPVSFSFLQPIGDFLSGLHEPLHGFDYTTRQPIPGDRIDWAFLFVRSTGRDCKEHGGFGIWLLARTENQDFAGAPNASDPNQQYPNGTTLTLYWITTVQLTMSNVSGTDPLSPTAWTGPGGFANPDAQNILTAFPVLRYHEQPLGQVMPNDLTMITPYADRVGLNECGCPEILSGDAPPPFFQYWGLFYPNANYATSPGLIPWSLPSSYVDITTLPPLQSDSITWQDFPVTTGAQPPVPGGSIWAAPDPCTFGASTDLTSLGNLNTNPPTADLLGITTPPTGVFRWFCPEPPTGPFGIGPHIIP